MRDDVWERSVRNFLIFLILFCHCGMNKDLSSSLLGLEPCSPFLCRAVVIVFPETTIPDLASSLTSVFVEILYTHLLLFFFLGSEVFHFLPLSGLFFTLWLCVCGFWC